MSTLRIAEIFGPTVQGEGALIGQPTVFVRAGGCDYRCSWCDSLHAVDQSHRADWTPMSSDEVWDKLYALSGGHPLTVSLSGGNPAIQNFGPLIRKGKAQGFDFACETQGSVARDWFADLALLVLSPKPPSSGETPDWARFQDCLDAAAGPGAGQGPGPGAQSVLKIVIFDEADYIWARQAADRFPDLPLFLQPGNADCDPDHGVDMGDLGARLEWLVGKTLADHWFRPRILPQLHVLLWGNKRGV